MYKSKLEVRKTDLEDGDFVQYSICGKTRGGSEGISNVFLTKPVGVNENLGG